MDTVIIETGVRAWPEHLNDSNVAAVVRKHEERAKAGFAKYKTTTDLGDLNVFQWLDHLQEELMDAAIYVERVRKDLHKEASAFFDARVRVEQALFDAAKKGTPLLPDELRALAKKIGTDRVDRT